MLDIRESVIYKIGVLVVVLLISTNLILLSFKLSSAEAKSISPSDLISNFSNSSNRVSKSFANTEKSILNGISSTGNFIGGSVVGSVTFVSGIFKGGINIASEAVVGSVNVTKNVADGLVKVASNATNLHEYIKPANQVSSPIINPVNIPAATKLPVQTPLPVKTAAPPIIQNDQLAQWPIHGAITLPFGVSDWPFEAVHTGIDISDGKPRGTTPIKTFKPGVVFQVIHSYGGLGNHIVIDNGGGITSVYGHLNSTSVNDGQRVDENTVLGYEGTTGASTGVHLHFEIRINGIAVNPRNYINGLP
ncbi:MAG TPA: peptidoglycan DD-metalloendopeptidase family protein [Patescibacteria group bacterium]|nr:peptidoglycan DD-metalloendopeptidase family protein [Patescibacteria group bacterium]